MSHKCDTYSQSNIKFTEMSIIFHLLLADLGVVHILRNHCGEGVRQ